MSHRRNAFREKGAASVENERGTADCGNTNSRPDSLTNRDYWSDWHRMQVSTPTAPMRRLRRLLRRLKRGYESHAMLVYWYMVEAYLPKEGSIVELGCAPGRLLSDLCGRTELRPFGVDYCEHGYRRTLEHFKQERRDPSGIMHADFTDPEFRRIHANRFDVVWSAGVMEHFRNPRDIISYHVELLRSGGTLVVSIPNLAGIMHPLYTAFDPEVLAAHNLDIMCRPEFSRLFADQGLEAKYCDYVGILQLSLAVPKRCRRLNAFARAIQVVFDTVLINATRHRDFPNRFTSPYLLYIGKKIA